MIKKPPHQIAYCFNICPKDLFDLIKKYIVNLHVFKGLPSKEDLERWSVIEEHSVHALDNLMAKCSTSQDICDLFTVFKNHMNFTGGGVS